MTKFNTKIINLIRGNLNDFNVEETTNLFIKYKYLKQIPHRFHNHFKSGILYIYLYKSDICPPNPINEKYIGEEKISQYNVRYTIKNKKYKWEKLDLSLDEKKENIYDNTLLLHYNKIEILKDTMNEALNSGKAQEYLNFYFSNIGDLIFHFNSYLLNYCLLYKIITFNSYISHKDNENGIIDMLLKIQKHKSLNNDKKFKSHINNIRIYETFFRHTYAHGKLINTVHTLLFSNAIFILRKKDLQITGSKCENNDRLRILLMEDKLSYFKKLFQKEGITITSKQYKRWNKSSAQEYKSYLLDENLSRSYINSYPSDFITYSPSSVAHLCKNFFRNNFSNKFQIICYILKNEKKRQFYEFPITYDLIKTEIENIIYLIK